MLEGPFERPSYVSGTGEPDERVVFSLIETTKATIDALERQKNNAPKPALPSIEAQIRAKQKLLEELLAKQSMD